MVPYHFVEEPLRQWIRGKLAGGRSSAMVAWKA